MRLRCGLLVTVPLLFAAPASDAAFFSIVDLSTRSGAPLDQLAVGDTVTIGLRVQDLVEVYGLGASVFGYDESIADFERGEAVASINHAVRTSR